MAADDDLPGRIVVGDGADLTPGGLDGDLAGDVDVETEQCRHRPLADRHRLLHRLAAAFDEARRLGRGQRAGCRKGRVLAQRMAGDIGGLPGDVEPRFARQDAHRRETDREQRGLGVLGQHQVALGALEHQPREVLRQGVVDLLEQKARRREGLGQRPTHAGRLRALPGKHKSPFHARSPSTPLVTRGNPSPEAARHRRMAGAVKRPERGPQYGGCELAEG